MIFESILVAAAVAAAMEAVEWAEHKYVMHGFLWVLHRDHHSLSRATKENGISFGFLWAPKKYSAPG